MWGQQSHTPTGLPATPVLTRVSDIHALSEKDAGRGHPVRIRGIVTFYGPASSRPDRTVLFVQDSSDGIYVETPLGDLGLTAGDFVEIKGVTGHGWFTNQIERPEIHVLGRGPLPVPRRPRYEELALGQQDSHWVEIAGIVHSTQIQLPSKALALSLSVGLGRVTVAVQNYPASAPTKLLDSRIRIQGACGGEFNAKQQLIGIVVYVQNINSVRVLEPSTLTAETPPVESIRELARLSARTTSGHRVKVRGIVTLQMPFRTLFIKDATDSLKVETPQPTAVQPGDAVEVWGFPGLGGRSLKLEDAQFRRLAGGPPPAPAEITVAEALQGNYDSSLVRLEGRMFELLTERDPPTLVVASGRAAFQARVLGEGAQAAIRRLEVGSRLRLTGVCEVLTEEKGVPPAFRLLVRSPEDVVLLERPPSWYAQRVFWVLGLMGAMMLATAAWVMMLRKQVQAKTAEIREWLRREAALKDRYRDLLENAIDMVYTCDLQGNFTSVNNTAVSILGYTWAELTGMNLEQVVAPEYRDLARRAVEIVVEGKAFGDTELEFITKYGARVAVEIRGRLLYEDGKAVGAQGIVRNVTLRKKVEQQVRLQAAALEAAAVGIVITDRDGSILWVNPAFTALSGYNLEEVVGKNPRLLKSGNHDSEFYCDMWNTILSGAGWRGEVVNRRKDGTFYKEDLTITPVCSRPSEITHFVAIGQDISARKQAEETRAQLAAIVESSNDAISGVGPQGTITSWNRGAEVLYGYRPEEILGKPVSILAPPDLSDEVSHMREQVQQGERITDFETVRMSKDGRRIPVSLSVAPLKNARGEVVGSAAIARDITERLQAEEALRQSEEKYRSIVLNIPDVVWTVDSRGRIIFVSPNIERLSGFTAEEVCKSGLNLFFETVHPDDSQVMKGTLAAAFQDQQPRDVEYRGRCKDGRWIWVRARATGAYEKDGALYLQGLLSDITDRKRADEELRANRKLLRTTLDSLRDAVFILSLKKAEILDCNPAATEMFGYRHDEMVGKDMRLLHVDEDARKEFRQHLDAAVAEKGYLQQFEYRMRRKDGAIFSTSHSVTPLLDDQGQRTGWVNLIQDITERKQAEEELALLKHSIDVHYDGAYWADAEKRLIYVNDAGCKALGYEREELIGKAFLSVAPKVSTHDLERQWECLRRQGFFSAETVHRRKDGSEFPVELVITYVHFAGKEFACCFARDITERKGAEDALRESEQFNREIIANAREGVAVMDRGFRYQVWNPFMEELFSAPASEVLGKCAFDLFPWLREQKVDLMIRRALAGEVVRVPDSPFQVPETGKSGWISSVLSPHYGANGEILGVICILHDITERKRVEAALQDSEQRYREFIARSIEAVWRIELDHPVPANLPIKELVKELLQLGYMGECNDAAARLLGFGGAGEVIGKRLGELTHDLDAERVAAFFSAAQARFQTRTVTFKITDAGGHPHYLLRTEMPVVQDGMLIRAWGFTRDITELRLAEDALKESEERFRGLFENATVGIYRTTPAGQIMMANPALVKMLGYETLEELAKRNLEEQGFEPSYPRQQFRERMAREGEVKGLETVWERRDGSAIFVRESARAIRGEGNQILYYDGIVEDITERKLAEGMLQESEERFRQLAENVEEVLLLFNPQVNKVFYVSPAYEKVWGRSCEEFVRKPPFVLGWHPSG